MTARTRTRTVVALVATAAMLLAACGTRLEQSEIQAAHLGGGAGGALGGEAGELDAGGTAGDVGGKAGDGTGGQGDAAGDAGSGRAGTGPGDTGGGGGNGNARGGGGGAGGTIVVGSVGNYSGPIGSAYKDVPRALQAWAAATNAKGGLNGRKIQVYVYDDGGDASNSLRQVRELVEQRKAVAMVASHTTAQARNARNGYLKQKGVPVIGDCNANTGESPVTFSPCPTLEQASVGTARVGAKYGKSNAFGMLYCAESADCSVVDDTLFAKGGAKRAGLDPKYRARISVAQPDFTSECIAARNAGVGLLAVVADPNTVGRVAASCQRQSYRPQFLQPDVTIAPDMPKKPAFANLLATSRVFPFAGLSSPDANEFRASWQKYAGGTPSGSGSVGWAASKIFEYAARKAGKNVTSSSLMKQLYGLKGYRFGGLTVPLTFTAGKGSSPANCIFYMKSAGGGWSAPQGDRPVCS